MIVPIVIVALVVVLFFIWISINNDIVQKNNKCDAAWQTIDAQLQRRNDLIPNLVETVKGYAAHESGTLEAVTAARNAVATSTRLPAYFSVLRMIFRSPYTMTEITASAVSTSVTTVYISTICVSFMPHFSK